MPCDTHQVPTLLADVAHGRLVSDGPNAEALALEPIGAATEGEVEEHRLGDVVCGLDDRLAVVDREGGDVMQRREGDGAVHAEDVASACRVEEVERWARREQGSGDFELGFNCLLERLDPVRVTYQRYVIRDEGRNTGPIVHSRRLGPGHVDEPPDKVEQQVTRQNPEDDPLKLEHGRAEDEHLPS